jgi:signal transduction histidine kinase
MIQDWRYSIVTRLVLVYGVLTAFSVALVSIVFYLGTIGVLQQAIDEKIGLISQRGVTLYEKNPPALIGEIDRQLSDNIDTESEIFLLLAPNGRVLAGNLQRWPDFSFRHLMSGEVVRDNQRVRARLLARRLPDGSLFVVGHAVTEEDHIDRLVWRSLLLGALLASVLIVWGAVFFRRQMEMRINEIRHTAREIEAGDLSRRIPVTSRDEFGRLNRDINRMLDHIQQLMDGVRHVSNAIAHDLRTPLARIRARLDEAVNEQDGANNLPQATHAAIEDIDELMRVFEKLLQIAELESGMRSNRLQPVDLQNLARDMVEMYDAVAEEKGLVLRLDVTVAGTILVQADRNLLANALASLIDNAIKYGKPSGWVKVSIEKRGQQIRLAVHDNGDGVPEADLSRLTTRFYRVDRSRHQPGNGLGLSIVSAIVTMHGGTLLLSNTRYGFMAAMDIPLQPH